MRQVMSTSNVRATVRNDLFVHELRHRVSFGHRSVASSTTLINLCRAPATSCDGLKSGLQPHWGPGCWATTGRNNKLLFIYLFIYLFSDCNRRRKNTGTQYQERNTITG